MTTKPLSRRAALARGCVLRHLRGEAFMLASNAILLAFFVAVRLDPAWRAPPAPPPRRRCKREANPACTEYHPT
jgi:hypothetical protein